MDVRETSRLAKLGVEPTRLELAKYVADTTHFTLLYVVVNLKD